MERPWTRPDPGRLVGAPLVHFTGADPLAERCVVEVSEGLTIALIVAGLVVCGFAVFALFEAVKTLRSVRALSDDMARRLPPLIEKADVTVDAMNAELLRVDAIIGDVEEISSRLGHTVTTVQDAVNAPANAVNAAGEKIRGAWLRARRTRATVPETPEEH
jgi:uncharacterized protein YoxC